MTQFRRYAKKYVQTLLFGKNSTQVTHFETRRQFVPPIQYDYDAVPLSVDFVV